MRLSNTLMINEALLPSKKKAFTLAEVLITLSILGVVAALTIPALVNRNSDIAAQTKLKKAIAAYETAAAVYMAESGKADTKAWLSAKDDSKCTNVGQYFKVVDTVGNTDSCIFTTADGVLWSFNGKSGYAVAYDSNKGPRYGVVMWTSDGNVNSTTNDRAAAADEEHGIAAGDLNNPPVAPTTAQISTFAAPAHGYYSATKFLNTSSGDLTKGTGKSGTIVGAAAAD